MNPEKQGIYGYIDKKYNRIVYIGKDSDILNFSRKKGHMKPSQKKSQPFNNVLQNNPDRFEYKQLKVFKDNLNNSILNAIECLYIRKYRTYIDNREYGGICWNFTPGGDGNRETKRNDIPNGDILYQEHITENNIKKISKKYNCSSKTIANRIKKAGYKIQNGNIRRDVPNGHILHNENKNGINIKILAKKYNCHVETIRDRIKKCGYKIQNENIRTDIPDGETLYKEYKIEKSLQKLAKKYNCSAPTISNRIKQSGYTIKKGNVRTDIPTGDLLYMEIKEGKTVSDLSKKYNCGKTTIRERIKKYKIN